MTDAQHPVNEFERELRVHQPREDRPEECLIDVAPWPCWYARLREHLAAIELERNADRSEADRLRGELWLARHSPIEDPDLMRRCRDEVEVLRILAGHLVVLARRAAGSDSAAIERANRLPGIVIDMTEGSDTDWFAVARLMGWA